MASAGVNGKSIAITLVGAILAYSGIKGHKITTTVRDLVAGSNPGDNQTVDLPITGNGNGSAPAPPSSKIGSAGFGVGEVSHGKNVRMGKKLAAQLGWTGDQWNALNSLWTRESGWRNTAQNPTSTAYGIAQFLDSTWAGSGYKKTSNPVIQIMAGLVYIKHRYGSPLAAIAHENQYGWY